AFNAQGDLFVSNYNFGAANQGTVSKVTPGGQVSPFASGFTQPLGLAFNSQGDLFVANRNFSQIGTVSEVTPTGQVSTFASGFQGPYGLAFEPSQVPTVPEPSSLTLLGIGTISLLGYGWRRRKQAAAC